MRDLVEEGIVLVEVVVEHHHVVGFQRARELVGVKNLSRGGKCALHLRIANLNVLIYQVGVYDDACPVLGGRLKDHVEVGVSQVLSLHQHVRECETRLQTQTVERLERHLDLFGRIRVPHKGAAAIEHAPRKTAVDALDAHVVEEKLRTIPHDLGKYQVSLKSDRKVGHSVINHKGYGLSRLGCLGKAKRRRQHTPPPALDYLS